MKTRINAFVPLFYMLSNNLRLVMIPTSQYIELNDRSTASEKHRICSVFIRMKQDYGSQRTY